MSSRVGPAIPPASSGRPRLALVADAADGLGQDALAFPGEHTLLLRAPLPLASQRQRLAAAGFAVEDLIAEPLETVHVALGPELAPGEYLVAVVRRTEMDAWAPRAAQEGLRLVPDTLGLPIPTENSWSLREIGGRVLVRCADGTGFATRVETIETFWRAAGKPQILFFGGRLPEAMPAGATGLTPAGPTEAAARFDLLQGAYARSGGGLGRAARRLAAVLAIGLLAHGAVMAAEIFALQRIAETREAELRAAIAALAPGLPADLPLDAALRRALPEAAAQGGFLPLLAQVASALEPQGEMLGFRSLGYDAASGSLSLLVEGPDLATLQQAEADLAAAGLAVSAGAASTGEGGAEVRFVVGGSGA